MRKLRSSGAGERERERAWESYSRLIGMEKISRYI
jgi:hypothetical protein